MSVHGRWGKKSNKDVNSQCYQFTVLTFTLPCPDTLQVTIPNKLDLNIIS